MADTLIAPAPLRTPLVDDKTPGLPTRAWSAWWQRVAEVVGDLAARLLAIEGMLLDVVPGVGEAEKALVLDANLDITSGLHDVAIAGSVRWDELELTRDVTDVLALKDGANSVTLRIYDNETDYSAYGFDADIAGAARITGELELGALPSTAGDLRMPKFGQMMARNRANDGNLDVVECFETSGNQDAIKFGDGGACWIGKTNGVAPADLSNGYFWVEYTGSSARLRVRVAGVTQTIASVSF